MKTNIFVMVGAAVVAVLVAVVAFLLYGEIDRFNTVKGEVDSAVKTLRNFYRNKPFPSAANVELERKNVDVIGQWMRTLTDDLRKDDVKVVQVSPAILLTVLSEAKKALVKEAEKQGTTLPAGFEFGFEKYAQGLMPSPTDVTRLNEQLLIVQSLCMVLFEEGATALTRVTREEFEQQSAPAGAAGALTPRQLALQKLQGQQKVAGDKGLYTKQSFTLEFRAKEKSVVNILNRIAKLGAFAVVTFLDIQSEGTGVKPSPTGTAEDAGAVRTGAGGVNPSAAKVEVKGKKTEGGDTAIPEIVFPPRDERIVSGPTLEQPLKVRMDVSVYKFEPFGKGARATP